MKRNLLFALMFSSIFLAGCPSTPENSASVENRDATTGGGSGTGGGSSITTVTTDKVDGTGLPAVLTDPKSLLSKRNIYFDYDRYDLRSEYKDLIAAHAKFLPANPTCKMLIQGNTDERGSSEYNLALGQKRADAVKRALLLLGVGESQLESVSLGKEKPANSGHNEAAWAENRRAEMLYRCGNSGQF